MITVLANGCFDLLHPGHVRFLTAARALGNRLIVGINSDASIRRLKGSGRPLMSEAHRMELLLALRCVDGVEIFDQDHAVNLIGRWHPDFLAKSDEYAPGRKPCPERPIVEAYGGRVVYFPREDDLSTTRMVERICER